MNLINYIQGKRKGKEAHKLEKDAMCDTFLAEALQGFDTVEGDHAKKIEQLCAKISAKTQAKPQKRYQRSFMLWGTAASLNLIVSWAVAACVGIGIAGGLIYFSISHSGDSENGIAINYNSETYYNKSLNNKDRAIIIEEEVAPIKIIEPPKPQIADISVDIPNLDIVTKKQSIEDIDFKENKDVSSIDKIATPIIDEEQEIEENIYLIAAEQRPKFMGKEADEFNIWVSNNIKYPEKEDRDITGRVVLSFIVDIDGKVKDVSVIQSLSPDLDREAIRVVASSPLWTPAQQMHKNVPFEFTFPIFFQVK